MKYASECSHVTELGVRAGISTFAFLMAKPKKIVSIDIEDPEKFGGSLSQLRETAKEHGIEFEFILGDTTKIEIEDTDLLMIDTEHNFLQLKTELMLHGNKSSKYIIMHDTTMFATNDSNCYGHYHTLAEIDSGDKEKTGLIPAIDWFLQKNPHWKIHEKFENCSGLMVLKRGFI